MDPITAGALITAATPLVYKALNPIAKEVGETFGSLGAFGKRNVQAWIESAEEKMRARRMIPQEVPLELMLPMARAVQDVSDPAIRDMFATLLTSAADPQGDAHPAFAKLLQEISPTEARILHIIWDYRKTKAHAYKIEETNETRSFDSNGEIGSRIMAEFHFKTSELLLILDNLYRLGLIANPRSRFMHINEESIPVLEIRPFGTRFLIACIG